MNQSREGFYLVSIASAELNDITVLVENIILWLWVVAMATMHIVKVLACVKGYNNNSFFKPVKIIKPG